MEEGFDTLFTQALLGVFHRVSWVEIDITSEECRDVERTGRCAICNSDPVAMWSTTREKG